MEGELSEDDDVKIVVTLGLQEMLLYCAGRPRLLASLANVDCITILQVGVSGLLLLATDTISRESVESTINGPQIAPVYTTKMVHESRV